jgi:hypothetical protein
MMKKFIFILIYILFSFEIYSQINKRDLPQYYIQNGDTIGVVLSVEQVQKLDNDVELLRLFEDLSLDCDNLDKHYIKVINELNQVVSIHEVQIKNLKSQNEILNGEIDKLKLAIVIKEKQLDIANKQKTNDSTQIVLLKKDLKKAKVKNFISWGSTGFVSVLAVLLLIISTSK